MLYLIYDFPPALVGIGMCGLCIVANWALIFAARHDLIASIHQSERANEMIGLGVGALATFLGLLLGLLSVAAYENYTSLSDVVDNEASSIAALYRDFSSYPDPARGALQQKLRRYADYTAGPGWSQQRRGETPVGGTRIIDDIAAEITAFEPASKRHEIIHAEAFRQFNHLVETRRKRLANVNAGLPAILWWVVGLGALSQMLLIALLKMELRLHMLLAALLSGFMGALIFIVAELDHPFRGEVSVSPAPIELVRDTLMLPAAATPSRGDPR